MHLAPEFYPTDADRRMWEFCERPDVKELTVQLEDGLIHPIEYATEIMRIAGEVLGPQ